ncbi:hypothetical protein B0J14DRAFT_663854 [Halenospora varia]|nr:hypothetical protein B0J14DRAFT_663854 [Halenospora varia]
MASTPPFSPHGSQPVNAFGSFKNILPASPPTTPPKSQLMRFGNLEDLNLPLTPPQSVPASPYFESEQYAEGFTNPATSYPTSNPQYEGAPFKRSDISKLDWQLFNLPFTGFKSSGSDVDLPFSTPRSPTPTSSTPPTSNPFDPSTKPLPQNELTQSTPSPEHCPRKFKPHPLPLNNPLSISIFPFIAPPKTKRDLVTDIVGYVKVPPNSEKAPPDVELRFFPKGDSKRKEGCLNCGVLGLKCGFESTWRREDCADVRAGKNLRKKGALRKSGKKRSDGPVEVEQEQKQKMENCCSRCARNGTICIFPAPKTYVLPGLTTAESHSLKAKYDDCPWESSDSSLALEELKGLARELQDKKKSSTRFIPNPPITYHDKQHIAALKAVFNEYSDMMRPFWWMHKELDKEEFRLLEENQILRWRRTACGELLLDYPVRRKEKQEGKEKGGDN